MSIALRGRIWRKRIWFRGHCDRLISLQVDVERAVACNFDIHSESNRGTNLHFNDFMTNGYTDDVNADVVRASPMVPDDHDRVLTWSPGVVSHLSTKQDKRRMLLCAAQTTRA